MELVDERRWATVLFADLCRFTQFSEHRDPEDVRAVVDRSMSAMGDVVRRLGGLVTRVIGDELMAVFGAPVAHEEDAERAVRAALEIERYASQFPQDFGGLKLRIGVNTGDMMFGAIGPREARQFTVMGDAVNVASRLQSQAPPGHVLVGQETYRASRHAVRYQALEPLRVKGRRAEVRVWQADGILAGAPRRPISGAPMLGRDAELALLTSAWDRVAEGRVTQFVTILGEPGIGKTRLCVELMRRVGSGSGRVVLGRSIPYAEDSPFGAFAQQIRTLAGIEGDEPADRAREKLFALTACSLGAAEAAVVSRAVAGLVGLSEETLAADQSTVFAAARRFVEMVVGASPTLMVFEDLQWASPTLLQLLQLIATRLTDRPVLFVALARPEVASVCPDWGADFPAHAFLRLGPLPPTAVRELTARLLKETDCTDTEIQRVVNRCEGNPLFLEEMVSSLRDHGLPVEQLPATVRTVISARLDMLPEAARAVIMDASVVGKTFKAGLLRRLLGDDARLADAFRVLETRELIRRQPASPSEAEERFAFRHALIQEVAYSTLPKAARRARHAAVARHLGALEPEAAGNSAAILTHHWLAADDPGQAVPYLLVAAREAARAWAKEEALSFYRQALELIGSQDVRLSATTRLERGLLLVDSGDYSAGCAELGTLIPALGGRERIEALIAYSRALFWSGEPGQAERAARRALRAAKRRGDQELTLSAMAQPTFSLPSMARRSPEAIAEAEAAVASWPPGSRTPDLAMLLGLLGIYHYWLGDCDTALVRSQSGYELGTEARHPDSMLLGAGHVGLALIGLGRHEEALRLYEDVVPRARQLLAAPRFTARCINMWAGGLRELYDLQAARRLNEEAVELGRRAGFPPVIIHGSVDLLLLDLLEGEVGRAERSWPELYEASLSSGSGYHNMLQQGRLKTARAQIALHAGHPEVALGAAIDSIAYASELGRLKYVIASRSVLGAAFLQLGKPREAVSVFTEALAEAERLKHLPSIWETAESLARACIALGEDGMAESASDRSRTAITSLASMLSEQRRDRFLVATRNARVLS